MADITKLMTFDLDSLLNHVLKRSTASAVDPDFSDLAKLSSGTQMPEGAEQAAQSNQRVTKRGAGQEVDETHEASGVEDQPRRGGFLGAVATAIEVVEAVKAEKQRLNEARSPQAEPKPEQPAPSQPTQATPPKGGYAEASKKSGILGMAKNIGEALKEAGVSAGQGKVSTAGKGNPQQPSRSEQVRS